MAPPSPTRSSRARVHRRRRRGRPWRLPAFRGRSVTLAGPTKTDVTDKRNRARRKVRNQANADRHDPSTGYCVAARARPRNAQPRPVAVDVLLRTLPWWRGNIRGRRGRHRRARRRAAAGPRMGPAPPVASRPPLAAVARRGGSWCCRADRRAARWVRARLRPACAGRPAAGDDSR
jgi:hypothetical protein